VACFVLGLPKPLRLVEDDTAAFLWFRLRRTANYLKRKSENERTKGFSAQEIPSDDPVTKWSLEGLPTKPDRQSTVFYLGEQCR